MPRISALMLLGALLLSACGRGKGELLPKATRAEPGGIFISQPQLVTFSELQADPEMYRDKLIRVTGSYYRLPPSDCLISIGPGTTWSLISENLRLDVLGFEKSFQLLQPGTILTVDGIFRKYEGPLGCGKRPPAGVAWLLEIKQIVQPNPLARAIGAGGGDAGSVLPPIATLPTFGGPTPTPLPPGVSSPTPTGTVPTITPVGSATGIGVGTATPSATAGTIIPTTTPSSSPPAGTLTATATPTINPTPLPGTGTPTPTSTISPTPANTQQPLPTSTTGGYPIPNTPTPTASPTGYPGG